MSQPELRVGLPVWLRPGHLPHTDPYPVLRGNRQVELAIVGGGLSGSLIALTMAEAGVSVAVVEANRAGRGSTAASSALLLQEPDVDFGDLTERYGAAATRRIWEASHEAARDLVRVLRRLKIACALSERPSVYFTSKLERAAELRSDLALRKGVGFSGQWLTPGALRRVTSLTGAGAILTQGNAQLDPYRASVGLLKAAKRAGAQVFERSTVRQIRQTAEGVRLQTRTGSIDAKKVIIATGYATQYFKPLAGRFEMRHTYVLVTEPLTPHLKREVGLGPVLLWDTETPYHYIRWVAGNRLMIGGADRPVRGGGGRAAKFGAATRELREHFECLYPALVDVAIDYAWDGLFAITPDSLPYIGPHRRYPNHWFALGYGGNGMTFAALSARILLEQWQGVTSGDHALFAFNRGG